MGVSSAWNHCAAAWATTFRLTGRYYGRKAWLGVKEGDSRLVNVNSGFISFIIGRRSLADSISCLATGATTYRDAQTAARAACKHEHHSAHHIGCWALDLQRV
jgi:hypothetical protein